MQIIIDSEFKALIPPLSNEEFSGLEQSLITEGCRDAIVIWHDRVIDGHNRFEICNKHGLPFNTVSREFESREYAVNWIINNQLSRRNITAEAASYLRGKRYNLEKKVEHDGGKGKERSGDHNDPHLKTSQKIATELKAAFCIDDKCRL